jgi:hypothetical protein
VRFVCLPFSISLLVNFSSHYWVFYVRWNYLYQQKLQGGEAAAILSLESLRFTWVGNISGGLSFLRPVEFHWPDILSRRYCEGVITSSNLLSPSERSLRRNRNIIDTAETPEENPSKSRNKDGWQCSKLALFVF